MDPVTAATSHSEIKTSEKTPQILPLKSLYDDCRKEAAFFGITTATAVALYSISQLVDDWQVDRQNIALSVTLGSFVGSIVSIPAALLFKTAQTCFANSGLAELSSRVMADVNKGDKKWIILGLGLGALGSTAYVVKENLLARTALEGPEEVSEEVSNAPLLPPLSTYQIVLASSFGGAVLGGALNAAKTKASALYRKIFSKEKAA
ncbi:MAG: hypothetical protein K0S07_397 [Chlamydiales bacterium]|jgi:hypothetical protein|nr:hypothetical protein [Chlamydiales bacterium]